MRARNEYINKRRVIIALCSILVVSAYLFGGLYTVLRVATAVVWLFLFYGVDHFFDIRFRPRHYLFAIIMAVSGVLFSPFYYIYPSYDKIQHFFLPMLAASIVYHTVAWRKLDDKWRLIFVFFVTTSILGIFELGEYAGDVLFDLKLQGVYIKEGDVEKARMIQDPLNDTMIDLSLGFLGTGLYCLYNYWKSKKKK